MLQGIMACAEICGEKGAHLPLQSGEEKAGRARNGRRPLCVAL
jgi:hypothetical protein